MHHRQTLELALPEIVPEVDDGLIECGYGDCAEPIDLPVVERARRVLAETERSVPR